MWVRAARANDVEPGSTARFEAGGHAYLLARSASGEYYAADLSCTHQYAELDSTSALVGSHLTCISHGATFDLAKRGSVVSIAMSGGATPALRTFPTRVEGDDVLVEIPEHDKPPEVPLG